MASIIFMPVCSKCMKIIYERVGAGRIGQSFDEYYINPSKCPYCGEMFDRITVQNLKLNGQCLSYEPEELVAI